MSIIQQIRDRAALLLTGLISISLIGFLVQDAFIGKGGSMFGSQVTSVGSIDGKKIELAEFSQRVNQIEQNYRSQGMQGNEMMTQNIIETIWNSDIQEILLTNQATKLGFKVTPKEIGALGRRSQPHQHPGGERPRRGHHPACAAGGVAQPGPRRPGLSRAARPPHTAWAKNLHPLCCR